MEAVRRARPHADFIFTQREELLSLRHRANTLASEYVK
jgi:hypothetical protein